MDQNGSAKRLTGVTPEANLLCAGDEEQKGIHLTLKPMANVAKNPKQGHQWPHKKD